MEEKDITANMARDAIKLQSNEEEVAAVFRLHIKRFWSQERIVLFCIDLLGVNLQDYTAWRGAVEHSVQRTAIKHCGFCGFDTFNDEFGRCSVCGNRRR